MASLRSLCSATVRRWLHAPLSSVIAMERSSRQKQSPTRLGDGVAVHAMTGTSLGDSVTALAMAGNSQEMASCPLSSIIAMERSLRQKQSPTRLGDGVAVHAMTGNSQEMASCPLSSVIAMEHSLRQKQSPTRLGDGVAALAMAGNSQEIAAPASHKSYFLKRSGNITRVVTNPG